MNRACTLFLAIVGLALLLALGLTVPAVHGEATPTATATATTTRTPVPTIVCKTDCDDPNEPPALRTATPWPTTTPRSVVSACPIQADGASCRLYLPLVVKESKVR